MDPSGDGGGLTATGLRCGSCGTELPPNSKFCIECGAPLTHATRSAEYKQVTVLFADVVHSMDIAAAVGAERFARATSSGGTGCRPTSTTSKSVRVFPRAGQLCMSGQRVAETFVEGPSACAAHFACLQVLDAADT